MTVQRKAITSWHPDVAGARSCKMDLHIHADNECPDRRARQPSGISGTADSPGALNDIAHRFNVAAVEYDKCRYP